MKAIARLREHAGRKFWLGGLLLCLLYAAG